MGSRKDRMKIREEDGVTILDLGPVEIWDGADLALLRDTFTQRCTNRDCRSLGIDNLLAKRLIPGLPRDGLLALALAVAS